MKRTTTASPSSAESWTGAVVNRRGFIGASAALAASACSSSPSLVLVGGRNVDATTIDADPVALLPSGIVVLAYADLQALYRTALGADVTSFIANFVPLGAESNFVPSRDTTRFYGGIYAMQGVDFCAVTQGHFDVAAIQRAADSRALAPSGAPLVKTRYADSDIYTVQNLGFVLVTSNTMLSGNEIGMRRALDRLRQTTITRSVPRWMIEVTESQGSSFAFAGDFGADGILAADATGNTVAKPTPSSSPALPAIDAASQTFPFLAGLRAVRGVGNFASPGVNVAGTLTYETDERAQAGGEALRNLASLNPFMNLLLTFGVGASLPTPQIARSGRDVAFTEPVDQRLIRAGLGALISATRR